MTRKRINHIVLSNKGKLMNMFYLDGRIAEHTQNNVTAALVDLDDQYKVRLAQIRDEYEPQRRALTEKMAELIGDW